MAIDSKDAIVYKTQQTDLKDNLQSKESPVDNTAKKINYWAIFGLAFLTIGIIATLGASLAFTFSVTIATSETILGIGSISLVLGGIVISKPITDKYRGDKYRIDPRKHGIVGLHNYNVNCSINALMQVLLNSPNLKNTLLKNDQFKIFIDEYEKAVKENKEINLKSLHPLLSKISLDTSNLHDSQELLCNILSFFRNSNPDLQNFISSKEHFVHSNNRRSINQDIFADSGFIPLKHFLKDPSKDTIQRRLDQYFHEDEDEEVPDIKTTKKTVIQKYFFGLREKSIEVVENNRIGIKRKVLEERKYTFAPKDLFCQVVRDIDQLNPVKVSAKLKINKENFETNLDAKYELDSFICYLPGHYISYIKRNGLWFRCDDAIVENVSLKEAMNVAKTSSLVHYTKR